MSYVCSVYVLCPGVLEPVIPFTESMQTAVERIHRSFRYIGTVEE